MQGVKKQRKASAAKKSKEEPVRLRRDDIIMGRGNQFSTHPGNVRFYSVIDDYTAAYFEAQTKFEKSRVVQQVFKSLSTSARFLRKDSTTKNFFLISDTDARQKISHAIRYRHQNSGSRNDSPAAVPSPSGATDGADFFNTDQRTSPCLQQFLQFSCASQQPIPNVQQAVIIELFSDEELSTVLGDPNEYQNGVYGGTGFDWFELSAVSPLQFPESLNENEVPLEGIIPESKRAQNGAKVEGHQGVWDDILFSMV